MGFTSSCFINKLEFKKETMKLPEAATFTFIGTGTSEGVPKITCLIPPSSSHVQPEALPPVCKVCYSTLMPRVHNNDKDDKDDNGKQEEQIHPLLRHPSHISLDVISSIPLPHKNKRNNTSGVYRFVTSDNMVPRVKTILVDCGKTFYTAAATWFPRIGVREIDAVLLTHGHAGIKTTWIFMLVYVIKPDPP